MEHFLNDHEDHTNPLKNSLKLYNDKGHTFLNWMQNQWKLRQHHDQHFPMECKSTAKQILRLEHRNKFKKAGL